MKLTKILENIVNEIESRHAGQRLGDRFTEQNLMTNEEKAELNRRYASIKPASAKFENAAIMLLPLDRIVFFHPEKGANVPLEARESNGDLIWAVIRDGVVATIFARRSTQGFDYWEDPTRGDVDPSNLFYVSDALELKSITYSKGQSTASVVTKLPDFQHKVVAKSVRYSGVILNKFSHARLLEAFPVPEGWEPLAHHMTIDTKAIEDKTLLGKNVRLKVVALASDDKVMAVKVETSAPSKNEIKHITIAVNRSNGGKPAMSNNLTEWKPIESFMLGGRIEEVE